MKLELKAISVWSAVKVGFVLNLVMGFLMGLLAAIIIVPFMALTSSLMPSGTYGSDDLSGMSMGVMLFIFPILYAIVGAIFGTIAFAIGAAVYNLTARLLGGLEYTVRIVEPDEVVMPQPYPPYAPPPGQPYPYAPAPGQFAPPAPPPPQYRPPSQPAAPPPPPGGPMYPPRPDDPTAEPPSDEAGRQ